MTAPSRTPSRTPSSSGAPPVEPPARRLRLLADLAPGAAVVSGLVTLWLLASAVGTVVQLVHGQGPDQAGALGLRVVLLLVGLAAAVLTGLLTYRLGVEAPRAVRGWNAALAERVGVLRDR